MKNILALIIAVVIAVALTIFFSVDSIDVVDRNIQKASVKHVPTLKWVFSFKKNFGITLTNCRASICL